MKPSNWERLQEIYHDALALPVSERKEFVSSACAGDPDLLSEINSLLYADKDFLNEPVFVCPSLADPLVGETIDGRFVVERELVAGAMGRVYIARDLQVPDRPAVIKVLSHQSIQDPDSLRRAKRELQALSIAEHPNVVTVYGAGEVSTGKPYIAMQHIDGVTLRKHIDANGMDLNRAVALLKQIAAALVHIHKKGVLHRDLKPENIMIQVLSDGTELIKILDFGIAKLKDSVAATSTVNTVAIGTVAYMSPEQLREGEHITAATDIYSLAVVACEMITGKRPPVASPDRPLNEIDLPLGIPENARPILSKALSFEPQNRHKNAPEFIDELTKSLLDDQKKTSIRRPNWPPLKKSVAILGAALVLAVLSFALYKYMTGPIKIEPNKNFKYWIIVQKMHDDQEYQDPFKSNGNETFNSGDKFQLNVSATEPGYLYIFNDGPPEQGVASFKMIYPNKATNNGSASVGANQTVQSDWITFRGPAGAENFWIVWSGSPVNELESARNEVLNRPIQGFAGDHLLSVREFLKTLEIKVRSQTRKYSENQVAIVSGRTKTLVELAQFKHR